MGILLEILQPDPDTFRIFGMELMNQKDFLKLLFRFSVNLFFMITLVRYIYYPVERKKEYLITFFLISTTVFLLCFLLDNVKLELGFALGLFAIFGILRYRTDAIPIKEMTYLFMVIGLSVINALANKKVSYAELFFTNFALIAVTYGLEKYWLVKHESRKRVVYENIELIKPINREAMHSDLEERTGIKISRFEVGRINFLNDSAEVKIFFYEDEQI